MQLYRINFERDNFFCDVDEKLYNRILELIKKESKCPSQRKRIQKQKLQKLTYQEIKKRFPNAFLSDLEAYAGQQGDFKVQKYLRGVRKVKNSKQKKFEKRDLMDLWDQESEDYIRNQGKDETKKLLIEYLKTEAENRLNNLKIRKEYREFYLKGIDDMLKETNSQYPFRKWYTKKNPVCPTDRDYENQQDDQQHHSQDENTNSLFDTNSCIFAPSAYASNDSSHFH